MQSRCRYQIPLDLASLLFWHKNQKFHSQQDVLVQTDKGTSLVYIKHTSNISSVQNFKTYYYCRSKRLFQGLHIFLNNGKGLAFRFIEATSELLWSLTGHHTKGRNDHNTLWWVFRRKFCYCNSICGRQKSPWPPSLASDMPCWSFPCLDHPFPAETRSGANEFPCIVPA
jgi:hypothetical protein